MKILRVAPDIYPYMVGGFGIHIHEMSKENVKSDYDITVYTELEDDELAINFLPTIIVVLFDFMEIFTAFQKIILYSISRMIKGSMNYNSSHFYCFKFDFL